MNIIGDTITTALAKLRRARRVARAQRALEGDIGQLVIAKHFGKPMSDTLRRSMKRMAEKSLREEGYPGVTVEVIFHMEKHLVEFAAHAEDKR